MSRREPRRHRRVALVVAVILGGLGVDGIAAGGQVPAPAASTKAPAATAAAGHGLFVEGCSFCHGDDARGVPGRGPSLIGVGAMAADFYLSTGRMPLSDPHAYPERSKPAYPRPQIDALVAYVASLGGPPIPAVDPSRGNLSQGERAFALDCAGCHQIIARGGIVTGSAAPPLQEATPAQIGEAVRVGPYLMPRFSATEITPQTVNSLARYIAYTRNPADRGGWGIGHIGPIPEGMVAWLLALSGLIIVARVIGERTT
ncbi:MAG: cytochrome bc1 complex diheme cytochrome c subunit [Solirubrobacteraceae bacterium]